MQCMLVLVLPSLKVGSRAPPETSGSLLSSTFTQRRQRLAAALQFVVQCTSPAVNPHWKLQAAWPAESLLGARFAAGLLHRRPEHPSRAFQPCFYRRVAEQALHRCHRQTPPTPPTTPVTRVVAAAVVACTLEGGAELRSAPWPVNVVQEASPLAPHLWQCRRHLRNCSCTGGRQPTLRGFVLRASCRCRGGGVPDTFKADFCSQLFLGKFRGSGASLPAKEDPGK